MKPSLFPARIILTIFLIMHVTTAIAQEPPEPFLKTLEPHKPIYIMNSWFLNSEGSEQGYDDREALIQFSFKKRLFWMLYFGYSHKAFWQIYDLENSRPFREQNYNPEAFLEFPDTWGFEMLRLGLAEHESNGEKKRYDEETEINYSRTWDRSYVYAWKNITAYLGLGIKMWVVTSPKTEEYSAFYDDNADMQQYMGSGELYLTLGDSLFNLAFTFRRGWKGDTDTYWVDGRMPIHYLFDSEDLGVDFYTRYFCGYGESLIDYNRKVTKFAFGVSFR